MSEEITPEVAPEAAPEVAPEAAPEVDAGAEPEAEPEAPAWQREAHKFTVDGEEIEATWDEVTRGFQKASTANKRFMEVQKLREEVAADQEQIKSLFALAGTDPEALMRELGIDPLKFSEARIMKEIEAQKMSPEQREALEWKARADAARKEVETHESQKQSAAEAALTAKFEAEFTQVTSQILEKAGLPEDPDTIASAARYIQMSIDNDIELDVAEAAADLSTRYDGHFSSWVDRLTPEQLAARMKESGMKKIRDYDLGRLKSDKLPPKAETSERATKAKRIPASDYFESIRKKHLG